MPQATKIMANGNSFGSGNHGCGAPHKASAEAPMQIGRAPPGERAHVALLQPGEDQEQAEQRDDAHHHEGQRRTVQKR